jgi:glutathione S-transferase
VGLGTGSQAIGRYIAEKYDGQGTPLLGNTLTEKTRINQWVEVEGQNFAPPATALAREYFISSTYKRPLNEELIATQLEKLGKVLDIYDSHLSQNRYLAGDYYSLADLLHTPFLVLLKNVTGELITSRQHVAAWCDDLAKRTAFKKVLESKWDSE